MRRSIRASSPALFCAHTDLREGENSQGIVSRRAKRGFHLARKNLSARARGALLSVIMLGSMGALSACGDDRQPPQPRETEVPEEIAAQASVTPQNSDEQAGEGAAEDGATPMEERVATIGLLNKRNNLSIDIEMKPGEARRWGKAVVRLSACERTAPWEMPRETGAFVQLLVQDDADEDEWRRVFSGWLFKNSPSLNVVEHPVYDVWIKNCAMHYPGEEEAEKEKDTSSKPATSGEAGAGPSAEPSASSSSTPAAPASAAPASAPSPSASSPPAP